MITRRKFVLSGLIAAVGVLASGYLTGTSNDGPGESELGIKMIGRREISIPIPYDCRINTIHPGNTILVCKGVELKEGDYLHKDTELEVKSPSSKSDIRLSVSLI